MVPTRTLAQADRQLAIAQIKRQLAGQDATQLPSELYGGSDLSFADLRPDVEEPALYFPDSLVRTYGAALYRDMVYAHLNRGQLMALGANSEIRAHYEASRIATQGGIT